MDSIPLVVWIVFVVAIFVSIYFWPNLVQAVYFRYVGQNNFVDGYGALGDSFGLLNVVLTSLNFLTLLLVIRLDRNGRYSTDSLQISREIGEHYEFLTKSSVFTKMSQHSLSDYMLAISRIDEICRMYDDKAIEDYQFERFIFFIKLLCEDKNYLPAVERMSHDSVSGNFIGKPNYYIDLIVKSHKI